MLYEIEIPAFAGMTKEKKGFTLIELSIVLVIIGLIVGGVLVGRDLIKAAEVRAEITQIEKFGQATNTFYSKYGYLPGDIPAAPASQFGFAPRGSTPGQGNGDGLIEGFNIAAGWGWVEGGGETAMFWVDLSKANLIEGGFSTASATSMGSSDVTGTAVSLYLPRAKIGDGNYVYVWNSNSSNGVNTYNPFVANYFGISAVTAILNASLTGKISSTPNISVIQAYKIDTKIDDGLPFSGNVQAVGISGDPVYAQSIQWLTAGFDVLYNSPPTSLALSPTSTTCADNGGNASNSTTYSITTNNGSGTNCALSFKFQ